MTPTATRSSTSAPAGPVDPIGPDLTRVGKTHVASALGHIGIRRLSVHFSRSDKPLTRLRAARLDWATRHSNPPPEP